MSDYFLNKIYDSLLTGKDPKIITERTSITVSSTDNPEPKTYTLSDSYYKKVLQPILQHSAQEISLEVILERCKQAGISDEKDDITQPEVLGFFKYIKESTDLNRAVDILKSPEMMTKAGQAFLNKVNSFERFNFINLLDEIYGGNFKFDPYLINTVKPAMARTATRGAPGPGEAFLAFFYNGTKPEVGDLKINGVLCELKKQEGRIGKNIITAQGTNFKKLYSGKATPKQDVTVDMPTLEQVMQQYKLVTFKDLILGKDQWTGISGVSDTSQFSGNFFNQRLDKVPLKNRNELGQIVGAMHFIDYLKKVEKFKYMVIFKEDGDCIGFDVSNIGNDPEQLSQTLNSKDIFFKFKSGEGSMFDSAGMMIVLK